ncbi:MAG: hypothetical protein ACTSU3_08785 [Candidatus Thorarchaeota archaeon]
MKRNFSKISVGFGLIAIFLLLAFIPIPAYAAEVWSDDFDDGNYDDWAVSEGAFTCADGYLKATVYASEGHQWSGITYNSTVVSGTWSFDYYYVSGVHFVVILMTDEQHSQGGYNLVIQMLSDVVEIAVKEISFNVYTSWEFSPGTESWTHIDVTKDESRNMQVFVNGTHRLSYRMFVTSKTMKYFGVATQNGVGNAVDNIVVSDTIDFECTNVTCELDHYETTTTTTTTTTTPTTTTTTEEPTNTTTSDTPLALPLELIALGGGAVVVVLVLVVFLKRKG